MTEDLKFEERIGVNGRYEIILRHKGGHDSYFIDKGKITMQSIAKAKEFLKRIHEGRNEPNISKP